VGGSAAIAALLLRAHRDVVGVPLCGDSGGDGAVSCVRPSSLLNYFTKVKFYNSF